MKYSENFELSLPTKADEDIVDVDVLSDDLRQIDHLIYTNKRFALAARDLAVANSEQIEANRLQALENRRAILRHQMAIEELEATELYAIFDELPTTGYYKMIHLVRKAEPTEGNMFDAYLWVNIGTADAPEYVWVKL